MERGGVCRARTSDGLDIAYTSFGEGPPFVYVRGLNSHLDVWWQDVRIRRWFEALAHVFTVYWFDARGIGLSDPADEIEIDGLVDDIVAVVLDAGLTDVTLCGQGFGSPIAIAFAARRPEVVQRLILYCAHASRLRIPREFVDIVRMSPEHAALIVARESEPDADSLAMRRVVTGFNTDAATAAQYFQFVRHVDVSELLAAVRCPTLVIQPTRSQYIPHDLGEAIANGIVDAELVTVESGAYNVWNPEVFAETIDTIGRFIGTPIPRMPEPISCAVLVTDIVGSTATTHRIGEERALELLHVHDDIVGSALKEFGGVQIKHTGDGIMATFTSPTPALECATRVQKAVAALERADEPLSVRIGISYGDVIEERDDLFGMTVVLAVRLAETSQGGQIVISRSAREAASAESFAFSDEYLVELKGFPEPVPVYEAVVAF